MTRKTLVATITVLFFLVFAGMAVAGTYMTYSAVSKTGQGDTTNELKLKVGKDGLTVELTTAIPGVIIAVLGVVGLLLLLIRIPVREVLGYETRGGGPGHLGFLRRTPVFSREETKISLLVWWLVKNKDVYVRTKNNV